MAGQQKLRLSPQRRDASINDDDGDVVMTDCDKDQLEASVRSTRQSAGKKISVVRSGDDNPKATAIKDGRRMLMVGVQIPIKKQKTIVDFFSPVAPVDSAIGGNKASSSGTSARPLRKKRLVKDKDETNDEEEKEADGEEGDDDDEFVPENQSVAEIDCISDDISVVEDLEDESDELEDFEEPTPKGKRSQKTTVVINGKSKESFTCTSEPCKVEVDPRSKEPADLPPMSDIGIIFDDIISRIMPSIQKLMGPNKYRKIRVATMCSGTESPLLALNMFAKAIRARGLGNFEVEHVFSCEIEPYKQAYIERNFKPPVLFRDVRELGDDEASTAYGARVPVPGDVDILIAGTSCVDFSNLNNKQKSLEDGGESGDTFLGMMAWVKKHNPRIVIQENVSGAAWSEMRTYYRNHGYAAEYMRVDSKHYYIPHTRVRGYMCAVNIKNSNIPNKWIDLMQKLKRNASTTLEAFMLPDDDPRVYKARMELAGDPRLNGPLKARTVDWEKCENRHQRERILKKLGFQRPITSWQEGGICKLLDFMWQDWGRKQVSRVLDLMDINFLNCVNEGYDPMYKAGFWNLSQNVDRNTTGGKPEGISPCLTPHMIAYLCYRGGPMTGIEALHMQGLPIDELLLTRETTQQIQNLAGNAMSSSVVGTAMLAALILYVDHFPDASQKLIEFDVPENDISSHIRGEELLAKHTLDLSTISKIDISSLLIDAERSSRLCICEGRYSITDNAIRLCTECGSTTCDKCGGRPSHVVEQPQKFENRLLPMEFEHRLKSILSMRLQLTGIVDKTVESLRAKKGVQFSSIDDSDWIIWKDLVLSAVTGEFRFKSLLRQNIWVVTYDAPNAKLELLLNPQKPEWRLFSKCPETEVQRSRKRQLCLSPIGRMFVDHGKNVLAGKWELCLPMSSSFQISIEGTGIKVPSWKKSLGFTDSRTLKSEVWSELRFTVPESEKFRLDIDISGKYRLLPNCGTAQGALHLKDSDVRLGRPPLFFFLDQERIGGRDNDAFVFSHNRDRLAFGETRPLIAKLSPKWRQSTHNGVELTECFVTGRWVEVVANFGPPSIDSDLKDGIVSVPGETGLDISCSSNGCEAAQTVLMCEVPLGDQAESCWPRGKWQEIDVIHERLTYESLAWLTERVRSIKQLSKWSEIPTNLETANCGRCAPSPPKLKWFMIKNKFKAFEDPQEAAPYERALKNRPSPFVTHLKLDNGKGILKIGLNVATLVHRALSRLPSKGQTDQPKLSWRLLPDYILESRLLLPEYKLTSNRHDSESTQPPNFITPLRPEQLRSLTWMTQQEHQDSKPFIEEEVAEAILPHLNWRAEGRVERANYVQGGVLADEVGYGKTAITIGLIDSTQGDIRLPKMMPGAIPVKATLIVVPGHLGAQWPSEIRKFTGSRYKTLEILNQAVLNKISVSDIIKADIILVLASIFKSDKYLSNLAGFACTKTPPSGEGRRFFEWQKMALEDLAKQVDHLKEYGAQSARNRIDEAGLRLEEEDIAEAFIQKKRLVGSAYVKSKEKLGSKRKWSPGSDDESLSDQVVSDSSQSGSRQTKHGHRSRKVQDPWKLRSSLVMKDWINMKAPPFEMFHFNRLVVDEFTYLKGQIHAGITSQKASSRWVLSGTPPLDDFADVKTISVFLNIHLGIDDDQVGKDQNKRKMKKDMTGVEQFTAFKQLYSPYWHTRRQEVAQAFLNQFVRQNFAEIDEIPYQEHIVPIRLPAAERAIYLELEHYLQALDYNVMKSRARSDNDRDRRQQEALGDSQSAEEALLKRCSHFYLDDASKGSKENAVKACDVIVADRKAQLHSCREDIRRSLKDALKRYKEIPSHEWQNAGESNGNDKRPKDLFGEFVEHCRNIGVGDPDANHDVRVLVDEAFENGKPFKVIYADGTVADPKISEASPLLKNEAKGKSKTRKPNKPELPWPVDLDEKIDQLKTKVIYLRGLVRKELAGRHRSLRYFTVVRDLQKSGLEKSEQPSVSCSGCKTENVPEPEIAVLSSCGHQGCFTCLQKAARDAKCLTENCQAATRALAVIRADSLGTEDKTDGIGRHHGKKLEKIVELIKDRIPDDEKVLVFVQFPDLMEKVARIFTESGIKFLQILGSGTKQSATVEKFQQSQGSSGVKVMLLNVMAQSSAGSNFTNANHAIMVSPLLTETDYEWRASETQAIGRIRRYGQTRKVHIWRFISEDTMDAEIYEKRTGKKRDEWEDIYAL